MLLELGVDTHVANCDGDVALDLAIDAGSLALVQLLAARTCRSLSTSVIKYRASLHLHH